MNSEARLKNNLSLAEVSRKWVLFMDAKAGFFSAMNAGLLALMWASAKLFETVWYAKMFAIIASALCFCSLLSALKVVTPRGSLKKTFGAAVRYSGKYVPVSFYGAVASSYPAEKAQDFYVDVSSLDEEALALEALEQHFTICHIVNSKEKWVRASGLSLQLSLLACAVSISFKFIGG